jgi:quinol monooxygenase YgiN
MTHERPFTGATVVINHRVRDDKLADYEEWLKEISPLARASPGNLDWHIVRPIPGLTATFTIILRFDSEANLRLWIDSPTRARLIAKAQPLFVKGDDFYISSGLDFWFTPDWGQGPGSSTVEAVSRYLVGHLSAGSHRTADNHTGSEAIRRYTKPPPDDVPRHRHGGLLDGVRRHASLHEADQTMAIQVTEPRGAR